MALTRSSDIDSIGKLLPATSTIDPKNTWDRAEQHTQSEDRKQEG